MFRFQNLQVFSCFFEALTNSRIIGSSASSAVHLMYAVRSGVWIQYIGCGSGEGLGVLPAESNSKISKDIWKSKHQIWNQFKFGKHENRSKKQVCEMFAGGNFCRSLFTNKLLQKRYILLQTFVSFLLKRFAEMSVSGRCESVKILWTRSGKIFENEHILAIRGVETAESERSEA